MGDRAAGPQDQSLPELLKQLAQEGSTLVRQEIDLAKAEVGQKVGIVKEIAPAAAGIVRKDLALAGREVSSTAKTMGIGVAALAAAGVVGLVALGMVAATLTAVIAVWLPVWTAALIVTVFLILVVGLLALTGVGRLKAAMPLLPAETVSTLKQDVEAIRGKVMQAFPPVPRQTVETVKEDVAMVKEEIGVLRDSVAGHPPATTSNGSAPAAELTGRTPTPAGLSEEARQWLEQRRS
jgi:uncharacterized membrane protein YqjE